MRKSGILLLAITAVSLAFFFGCKAKSEPKNNEQEVTITPTQQSVVTFDKDMNVVYGNASSDLPIAEDDENYYFYTSPRVGITPKDGSEGSSFKLFTDKNRLKKFFVYNDKIIALSNEDGLVTCSTDGSNIKSLEYNEKTIRNIYLDKDKVFFIIDAEEEGKSSIYSFDIKKNFSDEDAEPTLVNTIDVASSDIIDFASIGDDVYFTYKDEYDMYDLVKVNEISVLPLQSLPPDFAEPNGAFTDGGYIYLYSQGNKIIRYDTVNNTTTEIATMGQPLNAKDGFLYVLNQITARDIEIVRLNVKTNEAIVIYKNSENAANDSEEYNDAENIRVLIKSLAVTKDGEVIFVEEYTDTSGDTEMDTYLMDKDFNIKEI